MKPRQRAGGRGRGRTARRNSLVCDPGNRGILMEAWTDPASFGGMEPIALGLTCWGWCRGRLLCGVPSESARSIPCWASWSCAGILVERLLLPLAPPEKPGSAADLAKRRRSPQSPQRGFSTRNQLPPSRDFVDFTKQAQQGDLRITVTSAHRAAPSKAPNKKNPRIVV